MEQAVSRYGLLPFFRNNIPGFSIEEMTPPPLLFGGNEYEGCWEWKGPVIRRRTTAYGKFFKRKAGFVSLELLPYFLNIRRNALKISPGSQEEMLLDIISVNDSITSTELRETVLGLGKRRRTAVDLPDFGGDNFISREENLGAPAKRPSRHALEGPLQRLQMGGRICINDFVYKMTGKGERYGWGVAVYSTPESIFPAENIITDLTPEESYEVIIGRVGKAFPGATPEELKKLLKF